MWDMHVEQEEWILMLASQPDTREVRWKLLLFSHTCSMFLSSSNLQRTIPMLKELLQAKKMKFGEMDAEVM